jgi:ring-1,2-phenylacetyl-CoA epoxidase subunit PaaE
MIESDCLLPVLLTNNNGFPATLYFCRLGQTIAIMEELLQLRIREIIPETSDAATFVLESLDGHPLHYKAGQFLTLLIPVDGRGLRRSYSLSSAPEADPFPAITVKRVVNGEASRFILTHWRAGDVVKALPPSGRFILPPHEELPRDVFLIGAGSGLTPLFALVKSLLVREPMTRVTLISSDRNESSALFRDQLIRLADTHPQLKFIPFYSDPSPANRHLSGRLNLGLVEKLVTDNLHYDRQHAEVYLCGPFAFMRMVRMALIFMQFREEQIHREVFDPHVLSVPATPVPEDASSKNVTIHFRGTTYNFPVPGNQTILKAARQRGIPLPYSCLGGVCSTCSAVCTEGKVRMTINEVLTAKDLAAGWVLTCTGYPVSGQVTLRIS